ncbi:MAG: S41 family peptidase [Muribaculaceae bacterium]|nr:S41 family peptidase [Muribaculaceae bacterium]
MRRLILIIGAMTAMLCVSCHQVEKWDNDAEGNFDALWSILDTHYCFFEEKGIDWDSVYRVYRPKVTAKTNVVELYSVCADMLGELRDGHVNLTTPFATSYYKKWWSDYPQNYNQRLVDEYYLHFGGLTRGGFTYGMFADSVAYVRYPSFAYPPGEGTLDWMLALLSQSHAMIIDIRDNGGGDMTAVETIVRRFIDKRILAGYISHKSGPGHNDFSEPYAYYFDPADEGRIRWQKPVVVLTNRSTFSAANNFVSVVQYLPQFTLVGDRTGGGSGMPFNSEIPCGWAIRFSGSPVYDAQMQATETGIEPDVKVDLDLEASLKGIDTMLDKAIEIAEQEGEKYKNAHPK